MRMETRKKMRMETRKKMRMETRKKMRELDAEVLNANRKAIEEQKRHPAWGGVFQEDRDMFYEIGEKIGQGGEAKICAGIRTDKSEGDRGRHVVFNVFGRRTYLQDLVKLWPESAFSPSRRYLWVNTVIEHAMLLPNDGRIALVMRREWGDLRRLIGLKKKANHNQGPPFDLQTVLKLIYEIALHMSELHRYDNVVHRDLKASNVLLRASDDRPFTFGSNLADIELSLAMVSDYECALGVLGTGFWRAPEVLLGIKDPSKRRSPTLFTMKSDVYSYGVVCYEVATRFFRVSGKDFQGPEQSTTS